LLREHEADLIGLRWNWEGAYTFTLSSDGIWTATVVGDPATILTADTADELRQMVRADYAGRSPVPRAPVTSHLAERMST
jgi:hypothetical protein